MSFGTDTESGWANWPHVCIYYVVFFSCSGSLFSLSVTILFISCPVLHVYSYPYDEEDLEVRKKQVPADALAWRGFKNWMMAEDARA